MNKIEFKYSIGDKIKISAIGMDGHINGLMVAEDGKEYRVIYWWNGNRTSVWMKEWEIE